MNILNRLNYILFLVLFPIIVGCSVLPGTLEVSIQAEQDTLLSTNVLAEVEPVIESFLFGSTNDRKELISYTNVACTNADGLGGPPKCRTDQAEGTMVEVLPILSGEGTYSSPEEIDNALNFVVMSLYTVYRVPDDAYQPDYWPAAEYGLIFTREMNAVPFPVTVFVEDGRIVRLHHHIGTDPQELINQLPVEAILLTPNEAEKWVAEHTPKEPPGAKLSPDAEWLVISAFDEDPARSGVWLVNLFNPQQEFFMGTSSSNLEFSPWTKEQKLLLYFRFDETQGESRTWTFDLMSGEHQVTPLPPEAQAIT